MPVSAVGFRIVAHIGYHGHGGDACSLGILFGGIDFTVFTNYLANTDALVSHISHNHAAAIAARNYKYADDVDEGAHPEVTSAWFLPSAGQWDKMATAAGGYANLQTNADLQSLYYWSSSEYNAYDAWYFRAYYGFWSCVNLGANYLVRPCLAF